MKKAKKKIKKKKGANKMSDEKKEDKKENKKEVKVDELNKVDSSSTKKVKSGFVKVKTKQSISNFNFKEHVYKANKEGIFLIEPELVAEIGQHIELIRV